MILGIMLALIAGSLVSLQNIFNSKVNEYTGSWSTTTLVLGMGFVASFVIGLMVEGTQLFALQNLQVWHMLSGLTGVGVVICLVQGMKRLNPTYSIAIVLTSQLVTALMWDSFGWLGVDKIPFTLNKLLGVVVIVGGILVFKIGESRQKSVSSSK
ncbi:transporter family-2 protein [Fontibacillus solani]|uniref:Transporter family-2 protein n=1 Tax=Fontibacillus solani TaxID=1572857 RepID=A0A7W3SSX0_9BACL|nr:DMT family transporter [Fontibacillus solani]MBA9085631.1 transporter family-2 protein [Fontibacillus solani]